jgi:hypothetical protein
MAAPADQPAPALRRQWQALAAVGCVFLACGVYAALERGPWIDEFWTLWFSQHDVTLGELLRSRWVADYNPPLFSFWHWLASLAFGSAQLPHRLLNLLAVAWVLYFVIGAARRYPASTNVLVIHAMLMLSLPAAVPYFAELRSYFAQIAIFQVLMGVLIVAADRAADIDWRRDRWLVVVAALSVYMALNIHYISTVLAGPVIGAAIVLSWRRGQRRWALLLACAALLSALPLFAFYLLHHRYLVGEMQGFWVTGGVLQGLRVFRAAVVDALVANPLAGALAAAAALVWVGDWARRRWAGWSERIFAPALAQQLTPARRRRGLLVALALALVAFGAAMLVLQARHPLLMDRYLFSFQVVVAGMLALVIAEAAARRTVLLWLLCAGAVLALAASARETPKQHWDVTARKVAEVVRDCPSTTVYVATAPRPIPAPPALPTVLEWAHRLQGQRFGFDVHPIDLHAGKLPAAPDACPAVLWLEHVKGLERLTGVREVLAHLHLDVEPQVDVARARLSVGESGLVLVMPGKR